ncbi:SprB repeat-containing protein, partial [Pedobacter nyackensis]
MKKQLLFFNYLLRKGMIAFALLFFTLAVKTEVMASSDIDPPGRMVSNVKAVPVAPTVVTSAATNVGAVKATLGGDVTNDGGDPVTWRGIVWSTFADPEINVDPAVSTGTGTGSFSGIATGVPPNTTIHFRAFATNSFGTSYGADLTFTTNAALSATTGQSNVSCFGGSNGTASVTASGGAASYTYSWSPSGGTGATASGLTAGVYDCTITDAEGTVITKNVTITQPSAPVSGTTVVTNVACFGGNNATINLTPTGGTGPYTFNWGGGITTEDRTALAAGSYSVTITDANGCTGTVPVSVTQPLAVAGTTLVTNVACFGGTNGSIDLTPTGGTPGYTYNWGGGITSQDRISLAAGTYSVTITDANGCTGTVTVSVTQPSAPVSGTTVVTNVACNGGNTGAINLTPTGGTGPYTFNWGGGITTEDRVLLLAGSYSVTITDANGCTGTVPVSVTQPSAISTATGSQTNVSCFGGTNGSASVSPS